MHMALKQSLNVSRFFNDNSVVQIFINFLLIKILYILILQIFIKQLYTYLFYIVLMIYDVWAI